MKLRLATSILIFATLISAAVRGYALAVPWKELKAEQAEVELSNEQKNLFQSRLSDMEKHAKEWQTLAAKYPNEPAWGKMASQCSEAAKALRTATVLQDDFSQWWTGPGAKGVACYTLGTYYINRSWLYLLTDAKEAPTFESFMLHEYVHSQQWLRSEAEAYKTQYAYLVLSDMRNSDSIFQGVLDQLEKEGVIKSKNDDAEMQRLNKELGLDTYIARLAAAVFTIEPEVKSLAAGEAFQFTAMVDGASDSRATWGITANSGTLDKNGLYQAPKKAGAYQIFATITFTWLVKNTSATVTVLPAKPIQVRVDPAAVKGKVGDEIRFTPKTDEWPKQVRCTWTFSDDRSKTVNTRPDSVAHRFQKDGTYEVKLVVVDTESSSTVGTVTASVTIVAAVQKIVTDTSHPKSCVCEKCRVMTTDRVPQETTRIRPMAAKGIVGRIEGFDVNVGGAYLRPIACWDFGDGQKREPPSLNTMEHVYHQPGIYTVTVKVLMATWHGGNNGNSELTANWTWAKVGEDTINFEVTGQEPEKTDYKPPSFSVVASIEPAKIRIGVGGTVTFTPTISGAPADAFVSWNYGDDHFNFVPDEELSERDIPLPGGGVRTMKNVPRKLDLRPVSHAFHDRGTGTYTVTLTVIRPQPTKDGKSVEGAILAKATATVELLP